MKIIIDKTSGRVLGKTTDNNYIVADANYETIDVPTGHKFEDDITALFWDGLILYKGVVDETGEFIEEKIRIEKQWAISEIRASDYIAPLKDHTYYYAYIMYRQALREYYNLTDFTGVERPLLDKTIKNSLTKFQFMSRFTVAERKAITALSKNNQDLEDWLMLFKLTEEMNLNDPQTIVGVQMLEAGGIIGVGRAVEILA